MPESRRTSPLLFVVPAPDDSFAEIFSQPRDYDEYFQRSDKVFELARLRIGLDAPDWRPHDALMGATPFIPIVVQDAIAAVVASGAIAGCYQVLKAWIDARNGRKLKIRVGDIEVEATQMNEKDVLRIFELLQEKADQRQLREILLKHKEGPPDSRR